ncbi:MAG: DNA-directed DNA polymerase [Candidatus Micrarchaeia archaeon]
MGKIKAVFIDAAYLRARDGSVVVRLVFKRNRFFRLYDRSLKPYIYLLPKNFEEAERLIPKISIGEREKISVESLERVKKRLGVQERELIKVNFRYPSDVRILRGKIAEFGDIYEYDIPFVRRYMIDRGLAPFNGYVLWVDGRELKGIVGSFETDIKLRTLSFDIEIYNPTGMPRDEDPIVMISWVYESGGTETPDGQTRKSCVLTWKKIDRDFVSSLEGEKDMIESFCGLLKKLDVEVLFGYNSSMFDLPYLKKRADALGTRLALGRDGSPFHAKSRGMYHDIKIKGRLHVDLYPVVRFLSNIGAIKITRHTLGDAYAEMTGKEKLSVDKESIWRLWDESPEILADYSMQDALATNEIANLVMPTEYEMARTVYMPLDDVCNSASSRLVENLLMKAAHDEGIIIPNKPSEAEIRRRLAMPIKGAYVKLPQAGIYNNIVVLDFRGLYPSIICSHNVDPYTLNCDCCKEDAYVSPLGHRFCKKRRGLVPKVLERLITLRESIKRKLAGVDKESSEYKRLYAKQQALKILSNSYYGYLLYARSRWYSRECGESITAWGRYYITATAEKAEREGFRVLYIDTDSLFLELRDGKTKEDAIAFMQRVNGELPGNMELEFEGFYPRAVFVSKKSEAVGAKKKYALLGEDGRIKIRGFELVRRDWAKIAKETQRRVLETILREGSKEKAAEIVREVLEKLREGRVGMDELVIYTQIKKGLGSYDVTSPEVAAAQKAEKRGRKIEPGSLIGYVITRRGKSISEKAEMLEFAQDYDPNYYINNQVIPAVLKIMKELGYDEEDLKMAGRQQTLSDFMR